MAKIIELPKLSPTMEEGTLVRWAKNEGDKIEVDDLLAEVETDKATMEFRAFDRGTLLKRLIPEGTTAKLGQPVAIFGEPGEDVAALVAKAGGASAGGAKGDAGAAEAKSGEGDEAKSKPAADAKAEGARGAGAKGAGPAPEKRAAAKDDVAAKGEAAPAAKGEGAAGAAHAPAGGFVAPTRGVAGVLLLPSRPAESGQGGEGGPSSPRVRKLARERGVALESVRGSGAHGRITLADVERSVERAASAPAATRTTTATAVSRAQDVVKPASQMRKAIARRLTESKRDVPHFYLEADLDVDALLALREELNEGVEKDARVSVTDLLLRACALGLREVPNSNASWIDGTIVLHQRVDISLAVAVDDGLLTPVLRDVDAKGIRAISAEARELAGRARARRLAPEDMQGGVFSLSNLGMYGIDRFSAVINPPEGMILAVGATREVPVVRAGQIVPGKRCAVTLSCDHRVVDGALGAQFLKALRALVERPVRILL